MQDCGISIANAQNINLYDRAYVSPQAGIVYIRGQNMINSVSADAVAHNGAWSSAGTVLYIKL